jgi:hypothetical protein
MRPRAVLLISTAAVLCAGCVLLAAALAADRAWVDRHFLPSFWTAHEEIVRTAADARIAVAVAGVLLILASRRIGRRLAREPLYAVTIPLAIALALGTTELALRSRLFESSAPTEPRTHADVRLGWLTDPARTGIVTHLGHRTAYVFDRNGYRVADPHVQTDFNAPTILFTGESMMVGHHLAWGDTIPAQTAARLGVQSANIAVSGFATDQSYLRLLTELPRFRHPVAVVSLFAPSIFDRNLDDDRPHLGPGLVWHPPVGHWRIASLARRFLGYRSDEAIEQGVIATRDVLLATVRLARARGAVPLIVVPQFEPEEPGERQLRRRILDEAHLPYVYVPLDPDDRIENDGHPDADGARDIAEAIADALRESMPATRRGGRSS